MSRSPYKLLDYYRFEDADLFFGREEETRKMVGEILSSRLLVLFSPSGSGKTSLINAGVRPQLEEMGYKTIYTRMEDEPILSVCRAVAESLDLPDCREKEGLYEFLKKAAQAAGQPLVIFLDQLEEFFIVFRDQQELRQEFIKQVARIKYDDQLPVFLVLSLREDYFANLHEFREAIPSIFQNNTNIRLEPFSDRAARRAIEEPLKTVDWSINKELVDKLLKDLKKNGAGIEPIKLQLVCSTLWNQRPKDSNQITLSIYRTCGGAEEVLSNFLNERVKEVPQKKNKLMVRVFEALKTPDDTKRYRSFEDLQSQLNIKRPGRLKTLLQQLTRHNILRQEERSGTYWYEFKHDYLVKDISNWIKKQKERRIRNRFMIYSIISPIIILFVASFTYLFIQYNTFYAEFTIPKYEIQQQEIAITRGFNPFDERITTGYFISDVKDQDAINDLSKKLKISFWNKNDWSALVDKLSLVKCGEFLYRFGQFEKGIDKLINSIKDKNLESRELELRFRILEKLSGSDKRVVEELLKLLKDKEYKIRGLSAEVLGNIAKPDDRIIGVLKAALNNEKITFVRYDAAMALSKIGKFDSKVIDVLVKAINDKNYSERYKIASVLKMIAQEDERLIKTLIAKFDEENAEVRRCAAETLGKIGESDDRIIEVLRTALEDKKQKVRYYAAEALAKIGKIDDRGIEVLIRATEENDSDLQCLAVEALGIIEKSSNSVIEALIKRLSDGNLSVKSRAVEALANIGKFDGQVIDRLEALVKNSKLEIREQAALVLGKIGCSDNGVINTLVEALNNYDSKVWYQVPEALGEIGYSGKKEEVIGPLLNAFEKTRDTQMQINVVDALGKIGCSDKQVIEMMIAALKSKNDDVRAKAAEALGKIDFSDDQVIKALIEASADKDREVRTKAAKSLGKIWQSKSGRELLNLLKHPLSGYRKAGAYALLMKKSISQEIVDEIKELKDNDQRPWVRLGTWKAFEFIQQRMGVD